MISEKLITAYINKNANSKIKSRGNQLFKLGAIKKVVSDNETIIVKVQGGKLYHVKIETAGVLDTSCNCPYDWGNICKHEVAALLHLKKYPVDVKIMASKPTEKKSFEYKNSYTWTKIPEYNSLNAKSIDDLSIFINRMNVNRNWRQYIKAVKEDSFDIVIEKYYWDSEKVEFKFKDKELKIRCSCRQHTKGLCSHQISALEYLLEEHGSKFFNQFDPLFLDNFKEQTLKEYGIAENDNFNDYFELNFNEDIEITPINKGVGLLKLKKYRNTSKKNEIVTLLESKKEDFLINSKEGKNKVMKIGYVFQFREEDGFFEIRPISGSPTKDETKLSTHIRELDDMKSGHSIDPTETENKLLEELKQLNIEYVIDLFKNKYGKYIDWDELEDMNIFYDRLEYYFDKIRTIKPILAKQKYIYKNDGSYNIGRNTLSQINISEILPKIIFEVREENNFVSLEPKIDLNGKIKKLSNNRVKHDSLFTVEYENDLYFLDSIKDTFVFDEFKDIGSKKMAKSEFDEFFEEYIKPIAKHYPVNFKLKDYKVKKQELKAKQKRVYISEIGDFVAFKPLVSYENDLLINILRADANIITKTEDKINIGYRDKEFEQEFYDFMKTLHPQFQKQFPEDFYHLSFDDMIKKYWFFDVFEKFKENEIEVFGIKDLKKFKYSPNKANVSINIASGQDWFDVHVSVKFGDQEISLKDIRKAVLKQEQYIKLSDGTIGILPEKWVKKFENYFRQGEIKKGELKISKLNFSIIDEMFEEQDYADIIEELAEKRHRLKNFTEIKKVKIPKNFIGELRDYQKSGYNWLGFLDEYKWGGILADDMGLGKTIQILAFLLKQIKVSKKTNLIVIPTTLLFNWENEIQKFAPSIKTYFLYGPDRTKDHKEFADPDLVITTYGTMIRDIEMIRKYTFNYVILDESQAIKNPNSQRFKAASLIRASNKLALTGTPIENNTFDLYAQMDFINPGFLGNQASFKKNFSNPIDKDQNPIIAAELQQKISPFVLRRTKEQVATELPSKTEDYVFCEMETEQRKVYEAFKNRYRDMLLKRIEEDGLGKSKLYVLEGLTKLRQICDSPEILPDKENYGKQSIKIKELVRHVNDKTGNHKILVFSQFVKMLKVIRRELDNEKIKYEYLDGKSSKKKREASVNNFQDNDDIRVFLISLKAGGTGLNLTAADYVYIVDPWWNPAVENQAIDRCYRIGQDKKVIAYRMICRNTIEEKIMQHQAKKTQIASEIITTDESFVKQLGKNDIEDLFM